QRRVSSIMFQKYETNPFGLIFGGAFALILSVFGLRAFNQYLFTTSEITANELLVVVIGDIAGVLVAIVGIVMLAFGIHYTLRSRNENSPRT
ncbi:MAG TPA: hypothetical protein O0X10_01180, partial [Methanocorpusculum sp.]|nr:hypothetical protein [Methanocorpusculum sp.]